MIILKYIIVDNGAILFPETIIHSMVAASFPNIYAAGFVQLNLTGNPIEAYGESSSLKIKSIPEKDIQVIRDVFNPLSPIKYFGFSVRDFYEKV